MSTDYSSFIINQGEQPDDGIIEEKGVLLRITALKPSEKITNQMVVTFEILSGEHKGRKLSDFISYDPTDKNSWKYRRLRASARVPYTKGESSKINIGALLYSKVVRADLTKYEKDDGKVYQNIAYLDPISTETSAKADATAGYKFGEHAVDLNDSPELDERAIKLPEPTPIEGLDASYFGEDKDEAVTEPKPASALWEE